MIHSGINMLGVPQAKTKGYFFKVFLDDCGK